MPFQASESEVTSAIDDSNVDEDLSADIRTHLQTIEKINLAEDLSGKSNKAAADFKKLQKEQKAERRKKREQKILASALASDTEGYLTPGTFLKNSILKTAQAEVAASMIKSTSPLPESTKVSSAMKAVDEDKAIAEGARVKAKALSLTAKNAKAVVHEMKFDHELEAYRAAQEAWRETAYGYQTAIDTAAEADLDMVALKKERDVAVANMAYWHAATLEANARKLESSSSDFFETTQAIAIELAWNQAFEGYKDAVEKTKSAEMKIADLEADLSNVKHITQRKREAKVKALQTRIADLRKQAVVYETEATKSMAAEKKEEHQKWHSVSQRFYLVAEELEKAIDVETVENSIIAIKWSETATLLQQASDLFTQAVTAKAAGKTEESQSWNHASDSFYFAAEKLGKAIEAEAAGNEAIATKWREAAELQKQSMKPYTQAAKTYKEGKQEEGDSWEQAGRGFNDAAEKLGKAIEAEAAGNFAIATKWHEAATLLQESTKLSTQAIQAFLAGKKDEGNSWHKAGSSYYWAADKKGKAIEAEAARNSMLAVKWCEAAMLQQQAVDPYTQAVRTYEAGKKDEGANWTSIGNTFSNAAHKLEKAIEAELAGNMPFSIKWNEAAMLQQQAVDHYTQAARAYAAGNKDEAVTCRHIGIGFFMTAKSLGKAIELEMAENFSLAAKWRKVAALHQLLFELCTQASEARGRRKKEEGDCWERAGVAFHFAGHRLDLAISKKISRDFIEVTKCHKQITLLKQSGECYLRAARAFAARKTKEGEAWRDVGQNFNSAAWYDDDANGKYRAREHEQKAEQSLRIVNAISEPISAISEKNRRARVTLQQQSTKLFAQATQARKEGKTSEAANWEQAGQSFNLAAEKIEKAIEVEATGNDARATKWREAAALHEQSADPFTQAAKAYQIGKTSEATSWNNAGCALYNAANNLEKAIRAEILRNTDPAAKWREAATLHQQSAEPYTQAARAHKKGKTNEATSWNNAGQGFCLAAVDLRIDS